MTLQRQKLINSGCLVYAQVRLEVRSRCGSCIHSLDKALQCVGHYRTIDGPYAATADLLAPVGVASPCLVVVDWRFDPAHPEEVAFVDVVPFHNRQRL